MSARRPRERNHRVVIHDTTANHLYRSTGSVKEVARKPPRFCLKPDESTAVPERLGDF